MPIEIREVVIRANVSGGAKGEDGAKSPEPSSSDRLVATCVEKVMEILNDKKDR